MKENKINEAGTCYRAGGHQTVEDGNGIEICIRCGEKSEPTNAVNRKNGKRRTGKKDLSQE
ncbi:MAG: hypothetical protein ABEJ56_06725 [Candidatus Nanohaloarchaea archaeon]